MRRFFLLALLFLGMGSVMAQDVSVKPEEICAAAQSFLNALLKPNDFQKAMGPVFKTETSYGIVFREYNCLENFPLARRTTITDTNRLVHFRSAKALMLEETTGVKHISKDLEKLLNMYIELFKSCLVPNKFVYDEGQSLTSHAFAVAFKLKLPSEKSANPFETMRAAGGQTIQVEIYIDQKQNTDGTYNNQLFLEFKRV